MMVHKFPSSLPKNKIEWYVFLTLGHFFLLSQPDISYHNLTSQILKFQEDICICGLIWIWAFFSLPHIPKNWKTKTFSSFSLFFSSLLTKSEASSEAICPIYLSWCNSSFIPSHFLQSQTSAYCIPLFIYRCGRAVSTVAYWYLHLWKRTLGVWKVSSKPLTVP